MHRGQSTHQLPLPVLDSVPEYPSPYSSHQSMIPAHGNYPSPNPNTYLDHSVSSRNSSRPSTGSSLASGRYHTEAPPNTSPYGSSGGSYLQPSGSSSESYGPPRSYSSQSYESEWNTTHSYGSNVGPGVPTSRSILGDRLSSHESSQAPSSHRYPWYLRISQALLSGTLKTHLLRCTKDFLLYIYSVYILIYTFVLLCSVHRITDIRLLSIMHFNSTLLSLFALCCCELFWRPVLIGVMTFLLQGFNAANSKLTMNLQGWWVIALFNPST